MLKKITLITSFLLLNLLCFAQINFELVTTVANFTTKEMVVELRVNDANSATVVEFPLLWDAAVIQLNSFDDPPYLWNGTVSDLRVVTEASRLFYLWSDSNGNPLGESPANGTVLLTLRFTILDSSGDPNFRVINQPERDIFIIENGNEVVNPVFDLSAATLDQSGNSLTVSSSSTNVSCNGDSDGTISLTPSDGTAPYTYDWSDNSLDGDQNPTGLAVGAYSVKVSDSSTPTQSTTLSFTITQPTSIVIGATVNNESVTAVSDGSINVNPSGGTAPYSYNWNTSSTDNPLTGLTAGNYTVVVRDANACTNSRSFTVETDTPLSSNLTFKVFSTEFDCANNKFKIKINVFNFDLTSFALGLSWNKDAISYTGTTGETLPSTVIINDADAANGNYTYNWIYQNLPATLAVNNNSTIFELNFDILPGNNPINFMVASKEATQGVSDIPEADIDTDITMVSSDAFEINLIGTNPTPGNSDGSISASISGGTNPFTFTWSNGTNGVGVDQITGLTAGNYTVIVEDANGCMVEKTITLQEVNNVLAVSGVVTDVNCNGDANGSIALSVSGGTGNYTYDWSDNQFDEQSNLTDLPAATYGLTVTDGVSQVLESFIVGSPAVLNITGSVQYESVAEANDGSITTTVTGGNGGNSFSWSNGGTGATLTNLASGSYSVVVTDSKGCTDSEVFNVGLDDTGDFSVNAVTTEIDCNNNEVRIGIFGNNFDLSSMDIDLMWSTGALTYVNTEMGSLPASTIINDTDAATTGAYSLTWIFDNVPATAILGSNVPLFTLVFTIDDDTVDPEFMITAIEATAGVSELTNISTNVSQVVLSSLAATTQANNPTAAGNDGSITATPTGGVQPYTFNWSNGVNGVGQNQITNLSAGNYTVIITDANGCQITKSVTLTQQSTDLSLTGSVSPSSCVGLPTGTISLTVSGGSSPYTFDWDDDNLDGIQNPTGLGPNTYSVTVTDADNNTVVGSFVVNQLGSLNIVSFVNDASSGNNDGSININVTGGVGPYSYDWDDLIGNNNPEDRTNLASGTYSVFVIDANGCSGQKNNIVVGTDRNVLRFDAMTTSDGCDAASLQVSILVENFDDLVGASFGMMWDSDVLSFQNTSNVNTLLTGDVQFPNQGSGKLGFVWVSSTPSNGTTIADDETLFILNFNVLNANGDPSFEITNLPGVTILAVDESLSDITDIEVGSFVFIPVDNTPPVFTVQPTNQVVQVEDSFCDRPVTWVDVELTDDCAVTSLTWVMTGATENTSPATGINKASGETFNSGTTTLTYTAKDAAGNETTYSFDIKVEDIVPPSLFPGCPLDIILNADEGECGAIATWPTFSATDNCGEVSLTVTPANGSLFPVGETLVEVIATDEAGLIKTCQFRVIVTDTQTPTITCPTDITVTADQGDATANVTVPLATAADNCNFTVSNDFNNTPNASGIYPIGTTAVKFIVTDENGLKDSCSMNVTVERFEPLVITCPANITVDADAGDCTAGVTVPLATLTGVITNTTVVNDFNNVADASGEYPVGTTTVKFVVTDDLGAKDSCTMTVTVVDTQKPSFTGCPNDIQMDADVGVCEAIVSWFEPLALDNCQQDVVVTSSANPGDAFPVGMTEVVYVATDGNGNTDTCKFVITITDTQKPTVLNCPADITVNNAPGSCDNEVRWDPITAEDNCPGVTLTSTHNAGDVFPVGTTEVMYIATDAAGLKDTCLFEVTVIDIEAPTLDGCPMADISLSVTQGACERVVSWVEPIANDNCPDFTLTSTHTPGEAFPKGTTTVTYTLTDGAGISATCSFTITITDDELPVITCPGDLTETATGGATSVIVNGIAPVASSDNCEVETITWELTGVTTGASAATGINDVSGQSFNLGTTLVTYTIMDASGNTATCSFNVNVMEDLASFSCPNDMDVVNDQGMCGKVVPNLGVIISDLTNVASITYTMTGATTGASPTTGLHDASGEFFNIGMTTIEYTITSTGGSSATCSVDIIVSDDEDPILSNCPSSMTLNNDAGECFATVGWTAPTALDNCPGVMVTSSHSPNSQFAVGTTTIVTYTATDGSGKTSECSFTVTIEDGDAPMISDCPLSIEVDAPEGACEAVVTWVEPTMTDLCSNATLTLTEGMPSGSSFPTGTTTITYMAVDDFGNEARCRFFVTVMETTLPVINNCPSEDIVLNTDAGVCGAVVDLSNITVTDNCDDAPTLTQTDGVMPNNVFPVGTTLVSFMATDAVGNTNVCSFNVIVTDNELPTITCPSDISVNTNGDVFVGGDNVISVSTDQCDGAIVEFNMPTVSDNCTVELVKTDLTNLTSGDLFPIGLSTLRFKAVDENGNESEECTFSINVERVLPLNVLVNSSTGTEACEGEDILFTTAVFNNVSYEWIKTSGEFQTTVATTQEYNLQNVTTEDEGTYSVIITFVNGCTVEGSFGLLVNPTPELNLMANDIPCGDGMDDLNLTAENMNNANVVSWTWSGPDGFSSTSQNPVIANASDLNAGDYTVTAVTAEGCAIQGSVTVNVAEQLATPSLTADKATICLGDAVQLTGSTSGGQNDTFIWTAEEAAGLPTETAKNTLSAIPTAAGTFTYNYALDIDGCTSEMASITVEVLAAPAASVESSSTASLLCITDQVDLSLTENGGSATSWTWSGPNSFSSTEQNPTLSSVNSNNAGTYTVVTSNAVGCTSENSIVIDITDGITEQPDISGETPICPGESLNLLTKGFSGATYTWNGPFSGAQNETGSELTIEPVTTANTGTYTVSFTIDGCTSPVSPSFTVTLLEAPDANQDDYEIEFETSSELNVITNDRVETNSPFTVSIFTNVSNGILTSNGDGTFTYVPRKGFSGIDEFAYEICYDGCDDLCDQTIVKLDVIFEDPNCSTFHNLITPNNDGINDNFFIPCLQTNSFPNNTLLIFNQWGDQVFSAEGYKNDWDGKFDGKDLPDGTYYYIFRKDPNDFDVDRGFITLQR